MGVVKWESKSNSMRSRLSDCYYLIPSQSLIRSVLRDVFSVKLGMVRNFFQILSKKFRKFGLVLELVEQVAKKRLVKLTRSKINLEFGAQYGAEILAHQVKSVKL